MYSFREVGEGRGDDTRPSGPWGCGNVFEETVDTLAVIDESFVNHEILIIRVTCICIYRWSLVSFSFSLLFRFDRFDGGHKL